MANIQLSKERFLKKYSPVNCLIEYKNCKSVAQACNQESLSLAKIKKAYSNDFVFAYISAWLVNLNDYLNVTRKLTSGQIKEISFLIFDEYFYFKISDINLIFKRAKTGYYGKLYEGIDGMKILSMFHDYAQERMNYHIDKMDGEKVKDEFERTNDPVKFDKMIALQKASWNYEKLKTKK